MSSYRTRPPAPGDAEALVAAMRDADRAELLASNGPDVLGTVQASVAGSRRAWALELEGEFAALLGVVSTEVPTLGVPWLIGTTAVDRHPRTHIRATRRYLATMRELYPHLLNFVHADNHRSIRWLRSMGFSIGAAEPMGVNGELFHRFELGGPDV